MSIFHMLKPINITFTFYNILDFVYHCFHFYNETSSRSSSWKTAILDLIQKFTPLQSPWSFSSKATPPPPPSLSLLSLSPSLFLPLHLHLSPPICPVLSFPISSFPLSHPFLCEILPTVFPLPSRILPNKKYLDKSEKQMKRGNNEKNLKGWFQMIPKFRKKKKVE